MLRTALALCITLSYTAATSCMWGFGTPNKGDTPEQWMQKLSTAYRNRQPKTAQELIAQNPEYVKDQPLQVFHTLACTEFVVVPSILAELVERKAPIGACPPALLERENKLIALLIDQRNKMTNSTHPVDQKHIDCRNIVIAALLSAQQQQYSTHVKQYATVVSEEK